MFFIHLTKNYKCEEWSVSLIFLMDLLYVWSIVWQEREVEAYLYLM